MSEQEAALNTLRQVIYAVNAGDDSACLARMRDDIVIIDDVAPFLRKGRQQAEQWLGRIAEMRTRIHASLSLADAEVRLANSKAYIVAPGILKVGLVQSDFEITQLLTSTLTKQDKSWMVESLIWSAR